MATVEINLQSYQCHGYLSGFQIVPSGQVTQLLDLYWRLRQLLPVGMSTQQMDWWHTSDRELWQLCRLPIILDHVETILEPDFYLWGSQFFSKEPGDGKTTPWHQDAFYWPLRPHRSVTVWLAFTDADEENSAMQVIPGSHRIGPVSHKQSMTKSDVLDMEVMKDRFDPSTAVALNLKAGQISLHDDRIIHGSGPNNSQKLRCGLTLRYSAGEVKCDLSVWPFFRAFWLRGVDYWQHNPIGVPPQADMKRYIQVTPSEDC